MAVPAVILVLLLVLGVGTHGAARVAVEDAARAAARELARGESPAFAEQVARTTAGKNAAVQVTSDGPYAHVTVTRPVELLGLVTLRAEHSAQARARVEHLPKDPRP